MVIGGVTSYAASKYSYPTEVIYILYYILLPLNSACNPVIYLIRKEDMRSYVRTLWARVAECLCGRRRENIADSGIRRARDCTLETRTGSMVTNVDQ